MFLSLVILLLINGHHYINTSPIVWHESLSGSVRIHNQHNHSSNVFVWTINADKTDHIIQVELNTSLITNDSTLYIFDGDNYESNLLARISSDENSHEIVSLLATSGVVLIHLHSPVRIDFTANITTSSCPFECNERGNCHAGICQCSQGWHGQACEHRSCPLNCSFTGQCISRQHDPSKLYCRCSNNTFGTACLNLSQSFSWNKIFEDDEHFQARVWHASAYDSKSNSIFTFGGRKTDKIFNDLNIYSVGENYWRKIPTHLPGLWGHSIACFNSKLLLVGGLISDNKFNNKIWFFDIETMSWNDTIFNKTLPISFHTATLVNDSEVYILGGMTSTTEFNRKIFKINLLTTKIETFSIVPAPMFAHSVFYYAYLDSLIVINGNNIQIFDIQQRIWSVLGHDQKFQCSEQCKTVLYRSKLLFIDAKSALNCFDLNTLEWSFIQELNDKRIFQTKFSSLVISNNLLFIIGGLKTIPTNAIWVQNLERYHESTIQLSSKCTKDKCSPEQWFMCEKSQILQNNRKNKCLNYPGWSFQQYWNISNRLVPFKTDFIKDFNHISTKTNSSDNRSFVVHKLSAIVHPFTENLRAILNMNSKEYKIKFSTKNYSQDFTNEHDSYELLSIIGNDLIRTFNHSLNYEKLNIFDEIAHKKIEIELLNNRNECFESKDCFDCLSNIACLWQYTKQRCVHKSMDSITESVTHPSQCISCENIQNCLICNSLQFCEWKHSKCNTFISSSSSTLSKNVEECCEHHRNVTKCLNRSECLWCDRSRKCISKTSKFILDYELCENFNVRFELRDMNNCPLKCVHGRCQKQPELKCVCDFGWTGKLCDRDCLCNYHSTCESRGIGHCDKCRHSTTGQNCERCRPGFYGNATSTSGCYPCHCNGHGSAEQGLCHPVTGKCYCVPGTEGKHCERCSHGHFGDARDGGKCFMQCSTRTIISGLQSGVRYFGLHSKQPRNRNIDCVWIISADSKLISENEEFSGKKNNLTKSKSILIRLFPSNLSTNCTSSRLFIYDGIPESIAGSKLYENRYLPGICDGVSQTEFLATSGFATIILSSNAPLNALNGSVELYHTNKPVYAFPSIIGKTLWRKEIDSMNQPMIVSSINDSILFLHSNMNSMKITVFNMTTQHFNDCNMMGVSISEQKYIAILTKTSKNIFIHGGFDTDSFVDSNELLQLKFSNNCNVHVTKIDQNNPPNGLFGHSLSLISKNRALLVGGYSIKHGFNNKTLIINFKNYKWQTFDTSGALPIAILGHSASYSMKEDCLYVFGGKQLNDAHKLVVSNSLFILDLKNKYWSRITASNFRSPIARYLHSSSSTMSHFYIGGESSVLWAYSYVCKQWSKMQIGRTKHIGPFYVTDKYLIGIFERNWLIAIPLTKDVRPENGECLEDDDTPQCTNYGNCVDCLTHSDCQWCSACAQRQGECVSRTESCDRLMINQYSRTQICANITIKLLNNCPSRRCQAADCYSCQSMKECSWFTVTQLSPWLKTNQFYSSDSVWNCVPTPQISNVLDEFLPNTNIFTTQACSKRCHQINDCQQCLLNEANDCVWAPSVKKCLTKIVAEFACTSGQCGRILTSSTLSECPMDCSSIKKPTECIQTMACGWCQADSMDGQCMTGGLLAPTFDQCHGKWHFLTLPKENECKNDHHICDLKTQECIDLEEGFQCRCLPGHRLEGSKCRPVCSSGCVNGMCVAPNVCQCKFGYVGLDCSHQCHCHNHSDCPGVDSLETCLECRNNTMGPHCERCLPEFVGNPSLGIECVSCTDYCHGHSNICQLANDQNMAVCMDCSNHTIGSQCGQCQEGYFQISNNIRDGCRPCSCNGHGYMCSPITGEHCDCGNNTESERPCHLMGGAMHFVNKTYLLQSNKLTASYSIPCWTHQCTKCRDYFYGTPTNGHQCYRHMFIEKEYCFDPISQEDCARNPRALLYGRTIFFAVQPRYMNVDIRLVLTVIQGDFDIFLSAMDDALIVNTDPENGIHRTFLDPKILFYPNETASLDMIGSLHKIRNPFTLREFFVRDHKPLFENLNSEQEILIIRKLRQRIEITIPFQSIDLRQAKIFIMVRGNDYNANYGKILFRQDQCRIDLFVFFSVFFSSFFFCLSLSVMTWKVKQFFEARRTQIQREIELEIMASRPFGKITICIDKNNNSPMFRSVMTKTPPGTSSTTTSSSVPTFRRSSKSKIFRHFSLGIRESPKIYPESNILDKRSTPSRTQKNSRQQSTVIEPTSDGLAAIITQVIQLPPQESGTVNIAAASALIFYNNHQNNNGKHND